MRRVVTIHSLIMSLTHALAHAGLKFLILGSILLLSVWLNVFDLSKQGALSKLLNTRKLLYELRLR